MKKYKIIVEYADLVFFILAGAVIGVITGAVDALFGRVLIAITGFRQENVLYLLPFLAPAGVLIVLCYKNFGGESIKGMSLVFEAGQGRRDTIPPRLIPFAMVSTWITHLFGGSAGREGVAVQLGAGVANCLDKNVVGKIFIRHNPSTHEEIHNVIKEREQIRKIFVVTGMAAGFSGLFHTPVAALFFALEVLTVGELKLKAFVPAATASVTAFLTSELCGLEKFTVNLSKIVDNIDVNAAFWGKLALAGLIFGVVGGAFAWILKLAKEQLGKVFSNPVKKILIIGIILSVVLLVLHCGRYCGLGTNLISESFNGENIYAYDWILKFVLTILTLAAGYQGGEVTPLFSIGASLGIVLGNILGLPVALVSALGYAAVFGSATNTLLAPVFIGAEVFGFEYTPYFIVVCSVAYIFNRSKSIYTLQEK